MTTEERLAKVLHETYMNLLPESDRFPWKEVEGKNRRLAINTMQVLLDLGIIIPGENLNNE